MSNQLVKAWNYDNPKEIEFLFRLFVTQLHIVLLAISSSFTKLSRILFCLDQCQKISQVLKYTALIYRSVHSSTVHGLEYLRTTSCVNFKNLK
jgi:hypothetical protein